MDYTLITLFPTSEIDKGVIIQALTSDALFKKRGPCLSWLGVASIIYLMLAMDRRVRDICAANCILVQLIQRLFIILPAGEWEKGVINLA